MIVILNAGFGYKMTISSISSFPPLIPTTPTSQIPFGPGSNKKGTLQKAMGFGVPRLGIVIPKPILFALCLLGFIQYLISCLFMCLGLSNIIEPDVGWSDSSVQKPKRKALAALLIKEKLPVVRFEELAVDEKHNGCVVCLEEIQGQEEIRRLVFCRHVFHRECLDRWIDHDQKACPLCRTPLAGKMMRLLWLSRR